MSTTRSVRPTDLVALVSLDGRVYLNEARTWDRLGRRPEGPRLLDSGIAPWFSFASGRHTWISVQGQAIRALVSARQRGNHTAWEVDCLIAATEDEGVIIGLLEQVAAAAGHAGVLRIFLRLENGSDLLSPARRAGFIPYADEQLFRAEGAVNATALRGEFNALPYQTSDSFALYRLYNAAVPETVRRLEAPTFQHWLATSERRMAGRTKHNYIVRHNDEAVAQIRVSRERGLVKMDICAHPSIAGQVPGLIDLACGFAGARRPIFCLVPSYATALEREIQRAGFTLDGEYVALVRRTATPLALAKPARVHRATPHPIAAV